MWSRRNAKGRAPERGAAIQRNTMLCQKNNTFWMRSTRN
ncbi:predicted protein [Sclerotinia sclerotiorum 1980 UF-70]|uniref:Uncharacterized protein n=1 Tax=Sclerotinia sclerotiorum (strain ATCC 18683 / 1980 / Ss-1) TaxID=665079 RepID=A7EVI4_SCLS1|nr:predicted protein [Sclerotinia sclerotiorum 1980 UF-70]EDN93476.1 predicted protein [Sclerotinia sclerotiorum 1980 UF-70]